MSAATPAAARPGRVRLAVWKFASCDGCQLALLDCEDELLTLAATVEIAQFTEFSRTSLEGPYDLSLVEGSISTPLDLRRIHAVRAASRVLVTIGACATSGGIQALRNFAATDDFPETVYAHPEYLESLATSTPIADHVSVDFALHGCPVETSELLEVIAAHLAGRRPVIAGHSVCEQCKARGARCVLVAGAAPCLGPVTRAGCGARCPVVGRGCYGCFGPAASANPAALAARLGALGVDETDLSRLFGTFNVNAPAFRDAHLAHARLDTAR